MKSTFIDLNALDWRGPHDISFRIITGYVVAYDGIATRLDVKVDGQQFAAALCSSAPVKPQSGDMILAKGNLLTPKAGVIDCINVKVRLPDLIGALKELVTDLEAMQAESCATAA